MTHMNAVACQEPSRKSDRSFINILTTVLSANFVGTVLALLLEATFHSDLPPSQIASHFIDSFVYSNCIGILVGFAILSQTPRLARMPFPANWVLLLCMILGLAFVG